LFLLMSYSQKEKTGLEYLLRKPKSNIEHPPMLILLHGLGSNEKDLFQLADYLDDDYLIVFARAPYTYGNNGYKWYDLSFPSGQPVHNSEQAEKSRLLLLDFVQELKQTHKVNENKIFLGGFSQGAIMSYSVA